MLVRPPYPRRVAAIFDLEGLLLDLRPAWAFAVEQAVAAVTGRTVDALPLADEYLGRPWAHALAVLVPEAEAARRAESVCARLFVTSAIKRVTVPQGLGVALDALREARIELGVVSRQTHATALRQLEATGLDRFFTVLAPTPDGTLWDVVQRIEACLQYLDLGPPDALFMTVDKHEAKRARAAGFAVFVIALEAEGRGSRVPSGLATDVASLLLRPGGS